MAVVAALLLNEIGDTEFGLALNDALLLVAASVALDMLKKHQDLAAGVLFGLVAIKPQLMFLAVIALLIHQRWRMLVTCAATVARIGAISALMVGPSCALQWLGSATKLGEFQIGIGLPGTLARWTGSTAATEIAFLILAAIAVVALVQIRRRVATSVFVAIAIDRRCYRSSHHRVRRPLPSAVGLAVAQSRPWSVIAAGWAFTLAQLIYPVGLAPVLATELVPFVAVMLAVASIVRSGTPSEENPPRTTTASHEQLVASRPPIEGLSAVRQYGMSDSSEVRAGLTAQPSSSPTAWN